MKIKDARENEATRKREKSLWNPRNEKRCRKQATKWWTAFALVGNRKKEEEKRIFFAFTPKRFDFGSHLLFVLAICFRLNSVLMVSTIVRLTRHKVRPNQLIAPKSKQVQGHYSIWNGDGKKTVQCERSEESNAEKKKQYEINRVTQFIVKLLSQAAHLHTTSERAYVDPVFNIFLFYYSLCRLRDKSK